MWSTLGERGARGEVSLVVGLIDGLIDCSL